MTVAEFSAVFLARLKAALPGMTADELARTASAWAVREGQTAITARRLIDAEQAFRWRVARTNRIPATRARRRDLELAR
jgi:hypothetical protein